MKNKIFTTLFVLSFLAIIFSFLIKIIIFGQKDIVLIENRSSNKIPTFSIKNFLDSSYQNKLEDAVIDQSFGSETLKLNILNMNNKIFKIFVNNSEKNGYHLVAKDTYEYEDSQYLVYYPKNNSYFKDNEELAKKIANQYESISIDSKYLYFINSDRSINFDKVNNDLCNNVFSLYPSFKKSYLKINNFEDYKKFFYKTDHHWNYLGSYEGYKDIINLLFDNIEPTLVPEETLEFDNITYGSKAQTSKFYDYKENFKAYKFNTGTFKTYINGEEKEYGHKSYYYKNVNNLSKDEIIYYGYFYGDDYKEVIYDFNNYDKDNLLIIGFSDTNAINELVAYHFNKTFIVDLRHYNNFNVEQYIINNKIDKVLLVLNPDGFFNEESLLER